VDTPDDRVRLVACGLVLIVLYFLLVLCPQMIVGPALPAVEVDRKVCDFGEVKADKVVEGVFEIGNAGRADLLIGRLRIDCLCAKVGVDTRRIPPGGSGRLQVAYHTPKSDGPIASNVLVETNVPQGRFLHLRVVGRVGPKPPAGEELAVAVSADTGQPGGPAADPGALRVVLLYSPTCAGCDRVEAALSASGKRWGSRVAVEKRRLSDVSNFRDLLLYEEHYGSNETAAPKLFVGGSFLAGPGDIVTRLDDAIERELAAGSVTFIPPRPAQPTEPGGPLTRGVKGGLPAEVLAKFRGFSVGAVVVAGLIDGINPCAFTTIIFFLSMLAYLGRSRRQMALVGTGFTVSVFGTYLLLGLGAMGAIKAFSVSHGLSAALAYAVAALAFVLAGWSLLDCIRCARSGDVHTATLGLPKSVKARINKVIRVGLSTKGLLIGSITVGALVAMLESLCTGQVYLPTIMFVVRCPSLRTGALGYLVLYNLMFVAPLVAILVIAYLGVGSQQLGEFLRRRLALFKLAMAVLFAGLGALVLATL